MAWSGKDILVGRNLRPRGPVQLALDKVRKSDWTVIKVRGELHVLTAPKLGTQVDELVRQGGGDVVIDLGDASFIDSAGLHILLAAQLRLTRKSRQLTVVCPPGPVRQVIELARLVETLGVVSSLREHSRRRRGSP